MIKLLNAIIGGIVVISWAIFLGFVGNHISGGNQTIEVCGVVMGISSGALIAWATELVTSELKTRRAVEK